MYVVICYDIEDDRQRNRISRVLLDAGLQRVQKSVFEGEIISQKFSSLRKKVSKLPGNSDSVRFYTLCPECAGKTIVHGMDLTPSREKAVRIV